METIKPRPAESSRRSADSPWNRLLSWWHLTPIPVRAVLVGLPLLIPMLFYSVPRDTVAADSPGSGKTAAQRTSSGGWSLEALKAAVRTRATVDLTDDFRDGFGQWSPAAAESWVADPSGSARPARLALLARSVGLENYQFEFTAQIESKSLAFVVRAKDTQNYWASRLTLIKPGPLPQATVAHWAVVNGRETGLVELPLPMSLRADTIYRILVSVQGEKIQISINGQLSDYWVDDQFRTGGVGFFAEKGASFRLVSTRVWDKDDFLGRICYRLSGKTADSNRTAETKVAVGPAEPESGTGPAKGKGSAAKGQARP